ncbi:MAG: TolC family outer membrane protein [Mycoplasmataceae bacterium]|nr:TolC family outer membrane protein [Mycoplasmataceae bacterium]
MTLGKYKHLVLGSSLLSPKLLTSSIIIASLFSANVHAQTLQEAVQQTINENPDIQSLRSERSAVSFEIDQARAGYFPTVDVAAGVGWDSRVRQDSGKLADESSLRINQMVFDGFATSNEVDRHTARSDARSYNVFRQAEISALDAVDAYINVMRSQELLALAKENLSIHSDTNNQIQLRAERGIGKKAEAAQSNGRLALAERNTISEIGNLRDAATAYEHIIGSLPRNLLSPLSPASALPENLEQALDSAISNHPTLKSANADIASAFAQHATAKASYMPRFDLEAGVSHETDRDDSFAMLRMRYNLFNGGKDLARRQETSEQINQSKEIRDSTFRQVIESMRLSWTAYQTIERQMGFFKRHRDASIESNTAYQKQFSIGQRTLLDLLDSSNEMFTSKSAYINAKYDLLFSQFRVLRSKGTLTHYLGITLPVEAQTLAQTKAGQTPGLKDTANEISIERLVPLENTGIKAVAIFEQEVVQHEEDLYDSSSAPILTQPTPAEPINEESSDDMLSTEPLIDDDSEIQLAHNDLCYRLLPKSNYSEMQSIADNDFYRLRIEEQDEDTVSNYLLLAPAMNTMVESTQLQQQLKQQGLNNLWLFKSGELQGKIALGLFRTEDDAIAAQDTYAERVQESIDSMNQYQSKRKESAASRSRGEASLARDNYGSESDLTLEIVPRYKTKTNKVARVQLLDKDVDVFEDKFSPYLDEGNSCQSEEDAVVASSDDYNTSYDDTF